MRLLWVLAVLSMLGACGGGDGKARVSAGVDDDDGNPTTSTITVSWLPPTENTDNSALTDLAGYYIYYGTQSRAYTNVVPVDDIGITELLIENVPVGTYYLAMTAYNASEIESQLSNEVEIVVQ